MDTSLFVRVTRADLPAPKRRCCVALLWLCAMLFCLPACASTVQVTVSDGAGKPVAQAVASLHPLSAPVPPPQSPLTAVMDQKGLRYVPQVLAVRVGTHVSFPNSDNVRHHVYSFSPAKTFELRLYAGMHSRKILFDKPGVVVLGCNIHDWMLGFIDVIDSPWFATSGADGRITLHHVPPGAYELRLWQPRMDAPGATQTVKIQVPRTGVLAHAFVVHLHPAELSNRPPPGLLRHRGMQMPSHGG